MRILQALYGRVLNMSTSKLTFKHQPYDVKALATDTLLLISTSLNITSPRPT